jgi:DMSO/TMAO reductase YedYZ heme-binding membrane subunit
MIDKLNQQTTWQSRAFSWAATNKKLILFVTNVLYLALIGIIIASTYSIYNDQEIYNYFALNRAWFGRVALVILLIVITPGILGRFGIDIKVSRILTLYRRRFGILVFLLALTHYNIITLPRIAGIESFSFQLPLFQTLGFNALVLLLVLFVTSNDFGVKKLGGWWKRIHRLVYVILLLVLLHTALQRVSIWSVLAGIFFVLEIISFIYAYLKGGSFFNKPI